MHKTANYILKKSKSDINFSLFEMVKGATFYCLFSCLLVLLLSSVSAVKDDDDADQQV